MLTYETAALADWLDALAGGDRTARSQEFLEPNLEFELIGTENAPIVRISFQLESRPQWAERRYVGEPDLFIDIPVDTEAFRRAAANLREQLAKFPQQPGV